MQTIPLISPKFLLEISTHAIEVIMTNCNVLHFVFVLLRILDEIWKPPEGEEVQSMTLQLVSIEMRRQSGIQNHVV